MRAYSRGVANAYDHERHCKISPMLVSAVFILAAYLIGCISFAIFASWLFRLPDPRTYGSGNPGATNVLRSGKKAAAVLTLVLDALKGYVPVALTVHFGPAYG